MATKAYAIIEAIFQYNDEIYYDPLKWEGGGKVRSVGFDKEAAEKECLRLNIKAMRDERIGEYGYGLSDIGLYPEYIFELFDQVVENHEYDWTVPEDATDDQVKELFNRCNLCFYRVQETDVVESN